LFNSDIVSIVRISLFHDQQTAGHTVSVNSM